MFILLGKRQNVLTPLMQYKSSAHKIELISVRKPCLCCSPWQQPHPHLQLSHPSLLLDLDTARPPLWGEGAGGAPGIVGMAKHFPPRDGAVAPRRAQGAPGAVPRKSMVAASTTTLSLVPYLATGATLRQGVLPDHPSALPCAAPRWLQGNSSSPKAGGIQVEKLGVALCTQPGYSRGVRGSRVSLPFHGDSSAGTCTSESFPRSLSTSCAAAAFGAHVCSSEPHPLQPRTRHS